MSDLRQALRVPHDELTWKGSLKDVVGESTASMEPQEEIIGHAEVKRVFAISKGSKVAGCLMLDGRGGVADKVRLRRGDDVVYDGSILSLKRFQNDAREIREGQECGIRLDNYTGFDEGDIIEFYTVNRVEQTL